MLCVLFYYKHMFGCYLQTAMFSSCGLTCFALPLSLSLPARSPFVFFCPSEQAFASRLFRRRYSTSAARRRIGHRRGHSLAFWDDGASFSEVGALRCVPIVGGVVGGLLSGSLLVVHMWGWFCVLACALALLWSGCYRGLWLGFGRTRYSLPEQPCSCPCCSPEKLW